MTPSRQQAFHPTLAWVGDKGRPEQKTWGDLEERPRIFHLRAEQEKLALTDPHPPHAHGSAHHDHAGHHHAPVASAGNERRLRLVLVLTAGYALVQAAGGWLAGSLALIADSGHMASDAAALLLALVAYRVAARPADGRRTYGFARVRVLAALANGAALLLLVAWIAAEALARLHAPVEVLPGWMLGIAAVGLLVNGAGFLLLRGGDRADGNLRGALLHVVGDLLGSVGAIAAAVGIWLTGWPALDPILSLLVAPLVVRSAWTLTADRLRVLLQAAPPGLEAPVVEQDLVASVEGVAEAGHFHAWTLADRSIVATVHVTPAAGADPLALPARVAAHLAGRHGVEHATVQVDPPGGLLRANH